MNALPLVSFVIPVRNDAQRLQVCLDSIKANDYPEERIELIVVDNGSTDDSPNVARQAGAAVLSVPRASVGELRNRGGLYACGDILAFVDADHAIGTDWIGEAVAALSMHDVAAAGTHCRPPAGAKWVQSRYDLLRNHVEAFADVEWLGGGNLVIKRQVFNGIGGFDCSLEACEDVDLCKRIRGIGGRILNAPTMRSTHFGDPSTLRALFAGELWRGRDNLRVTLRARRSLRTIGSAMVPLITLSALAGAIVSLIFRWTETAILLASLPLSLAALRAAVMGARDSHLTAIGTVQSFVVALVYDAARAFALVARTPHHVRRTGDSTAHVTADSHS
jgi:GT2 family glycosyltransferase